MVDEPAHPDSVRGTAGLRTVRRPRSLPSARTTVSVDISSLSFETTRDVEILESVIEQDRAQSSLELGLAIQRHNYHVYVAGASGTGKRSQLKALLNKVAPPRDVPPDRIYLHNFEEREAPLAVSLPPGQGAKLKKDLTAMLETLREDLPTAFHARDHQELLQRAIYEGNSASNDAFHVLRRHAAKIEFDVITGDEGELKTMPIVDEAALDDKDVIALPDDKRREVEARRELLEPLLTDFVQANRKIERETQERLDGYTKALAEGVIKRPVGRLRRRYRDGGDRLKSFFKSLVDDFVENFARFLPDDDENPHGPDPFVAYRANVIVDNTKLEGAPVIFETHPTFYRLFGKIERRVEQGIYFTDHTMIKAGSLLRANGGYLVLHAADVFAYPGVWESLKTTLRNREATIEDLGESAGLLPTSGLKPEPIAMNFKLIFIGGNTLYHMAFRGDDDFRKIFQVKADFDDEIRRTEHAVGKYVRFIATAAHNNNCLPLDREGVAAVIAHGSRLVESQRKLTLRFNDISNVLIEASYHAVGEGVERVTARHVEKAIALRTERSSLIADKMQDDLSDGQLLLDFDGARVGVINGLAVLAVGEHEFGRPFRVTARCFAGRAGIVNIEREVNMSGEIHDKGVHILAGFLGHRFAQRRPLALTATVTFEQSYGAVDGDSASSTWLYGILSDLAGVPIDQGLGVTGSVNQLGEIQPVGGVNHKIEGFFRCCKMIGLTGRQGVLIPHQNVMHLMLDADVRRAMDDGQFHVWPVRTIDEGIEILTGHAAGQPDANGQYPNDSIMGRVGRRLDQLRPALDADHAARSSEITSARGARTALLGSD